MEWDSEIPPWDLQELEPNAGEANLSVDRSVDIKLGSLGDFEWDPNWKGQRRTSTTTASTSKRPRAPSNGFQNVLCLVDDCKSDLNGCREYHRRHKVCELHSKTPIVMVGGQEQRFCQQCSRFHLLVEFDDVKRSCRKRLDGHNRRRRKPQPESINAGNLFPYHHGFRLISYPQNFRPSASTDSTWINITETEEDTLYARPDPPALHYADRMQPPALQPFPTTTNRRFDKGRQFPFLDDGGDMALNSKTVQKQAPVCQPLFNTISAESSSSKTMLSDRLPLVIDSNCALSLLSPPTQTSAINPSHMEPSLRIPIGQPLLSTLQYSGFSCSAVEEQHLGTVVVSDATKADLHCHSMLQVGDEGTSDDTSKTLSFSWQ